MTYEQIEKKALDYLPKALGESLWSNYTEVERQKMITGFIFGYNEAHYQAISEKYEVH